MLQPAALTPKAERTSVASKPSASSSAGAQPAAASSANVHPTSTRRGSVKPPSTSCAAEMPASRSALQLSAEYTWTTSWPRLPIFSSWVVLSLKLVTVTSGALSTRRASSGVRWRHMSTNFVSSAPAVALWMQTNSQRRRESSAGFSPSGPAVCIASHASNCVCADR